MIDGKSMYWLHYRKHWIPDAKAKAGKQAHLASKKKEAERETTTDSVPEDAGSTPDKCSWRTSSNSCKRPSLLLAMT
jgi:hypothetical protein